MKNDRSALALFLTFLKIGAFTFGGGYAMIPLIQKETVESKKWISDDDILEIVAVAESTPGPIAVNAATFVGYRVRGVPGAMAATLGVVLPSFTIISLISLALREFEALRAVRCAFFGIRAGVLALLVKALVSMASKCRRGAIPVLIALGAFILAGLLGANVILVLIGCAAVGLASSLIAAKRGETK